MTIVRVIWRHPIDALVPLETQYQHVDKESLCYPGGRLIRFRNTKGEEFAIATATVRSIEMSE